MTGQHLTGASDRLQPSYFSRVLVRGRLTRMALFGFCLAGLFEVLVPRELLVKWMGVEEPPTLAEVV